jgi:peptidoglycan/xylan/chitin deacetylase (PgdA/CDA1 family)
MSLIDRKQTIVTTSWDDGHPLDVRVAELLWKYGLKGTFYVPLKNNEHEVMEVNGIRALSSRFEIGGHTINHVDLTAVPARVAYSEIADGKKMMEDMIGGKLTIFAYPRGQYRSETRNMVRQAGFSGARNASWFHSEFPRDRYSIRPTLHIYPHSRPVHIGHLLKELNFKGLRDYLFIDKGAVGLKPLTITWLDRILSQGGILHLWGHSWEIDDLALWRELEEIISYIAQCKDVIHLTNGDILSYLDQHAC